MCLFCRTFTLVKLLNCLFVHAMSSATDTDCSWSYSSSDEEYANTDFDVYRDRYNTRSTSTTTTRSSTNNQSFNLGLSQLLNIDPSTPWSAGTSTSPNISPATGARLSGRLSRNTFLLIAHILKHSLRHNCS